jgi:formylglycine-generating enzyme required for sulfatase activity
VKASAAEAPAGIRPLAGTSTPASETRENPNDGLTYVWIPPGKFTMGCSPGDATCGDDEKPAHEVTITQGFWLGQTPVTQQAYQRVMGRNPSHFKGPRLPVESVTWDEARAYCKAVGMRLPTEAEWEYAARAGATAAHYGNPAEIAWYSFNSGSKTHEVGQKQLNGFGLYDMLGNVWEWVADWYVGYQKAAAADPTGPSRGQSRVLRGGSWGDLAMIACASYRGRGVPSDRNSRFGFRCAGELP